MCACARTGAHSMRVCVCVALCGSRSDGENDSSRRIKTEFLVQMQGVGTNNDGVLVVGATNVPWELDPAIRRRFEKRVYIPMPDACARADMFKHGIDAMYAVNAGPEPGPGPGPEPEPSAFPGVVDTNARITSDDIQLLVECTSGYSGSDISVLMRDALYAPVRDAQAATHFRRAGDKWESCSPAHADAVAMTLYDVPANMLSVPTTTIAHIDAAIRNTKCTVCAGDIEKFTDWTHKYGQSGSG
jgi:vacuolar protein-sorting-associated protein 4